MRLFLITVFSFVSCFSSLGFALENHEIKSFQWTSESELAKHAVLTIRNDYGNVTVFGSDSAYASVIGNIQRNKKSLTKVNIDIRETEQGVYVNVLYPHEHFVDSVNKLDRVDIGLVVPSGRNVEVDTTKGRIKTKKFRANITARSEYGDIKIATNGIVNSFTKSGITDVELIDTKWRKNNSIRSDSGKIHVKIKPDSNTQVTAKTGGNIVYRGEDGVVKQTARDLDLTFGDSQTRLVIHSLSGDVDFSLYKVSKESPMERIGSMPSRFDKSVRSLPKPKTWKPGDAIENMPKPHPTNKKILIKKSDPDVR